MFCHRLVAQAWQDDARISDANGKARGKAGRADDLYGLGIRFWLLVGLVADC
uniref:Uncharacterized protein n=1 Tax=uncultured Alphaproteobacteria bacterium TaxID=91750 RepID=A0A1B0Z273_9PROT|nr:hypothetical protein [uncultured Alphaproteobacteria bacterium]